MNYVYIRILKLNDKLKHIGHPKHIGDSIANWHLAIGIVRLRLLFHFHLFYGY